MKSYACWLLLGWSALGLLVQGSVLWARSLDNIVELGNFKSRVPTDWVEVPPDNSQWYKQYRLEPINDDTEPARLRVSVMKKEKSDDAGAYVKAQMQKLFPPAGETVREAATVQKLSVHGAAVTYLDMRGDYKGLPGNDATPRENFRLLSVYFDTAKGAYLICLFGPADTVEFYRQEFEAWVKAFK